MRNTRFTMLSPTSSYPRRLLVQLFSASAPFILQFRRKTRERNCKLGHFTLIAQSEIGEPTLIMRIEPRRALRARCNTNFIGGSKKLLLHLFPAPAKFPTVKCFLRAAGLFWKLRLGDTREWAIASIMTISLTNCEVWILLRELSGNFVDRFEVCNVATY